MEIIRLTSTILMPIMCMYVIMALNIFERRYSNYEDTYKPIKTLNLRDIFLVTIVLDVVALISAASTISDPSYPLGKTELTISLVLLTLHMITAITLRTKSTEANNETTKIRIIELYFSFIILFTNAITIKSLILNTI